jgi:hypothetical protein
MDQVRYHELESTGSDRLRAYRDKREWIVDKCPVNEKHVDGGTQIGDASFYVKHNYRNQMIVWAVHDCLIHEELLDKFTDEGFTGFRTQPAKLRYSDGKITTSYKVLIVTGWAGIVLPDSGMKIIEECPNCHWKVYSPISNYESIVDWSQWTGDDFFIVYPLVGRILVTERVGEFLKKEKVKSYLLHDLKDEPDIIREQPTYANRLSTRFPKDLAIKYGRPLGIE